MLNLILALRAALVSELIDWWASPKVRPRMVWRMYCLARSKYGVCQAYYLARTFEKATRPKAGM